MGIGTLRRYHDDSREVGLTPLDESAVDAAKTDAAEEVGKAEELAHNEAINEAAAELGRAYADAVKLTANEDEQPTDEALEAAAQRIAEASAHYAELTAEPTPEADPVGGVQTEVRGDPKGEESEGDREPDLGGVPLGDAAAGAEVAARAAEDAGVEQASTEELGTAHGDVERPARTASTAAWVGYAEADPNGAPLDLTARPGLRDEIARHYLGE